MSPGAIPFHPLADLFPLIEGTEFEALCADIRENGLRTPIQIWNGQIIDGRNRYRAVCEIQRSLACAGEQEFGASYFGSWIEDVSHIHERLLPAHVVSLNLRRRHLDESQRALVAAKLANLSKGQRPFPQAVATSADLPISTPVPIADAAEMLNVSPRAVGEAKALMREAPPDVLQQAERGEVSVHGALRGVKLAKDLVAKRGDDVSPEAVQRAYDVLREEEATRRAEAKLRKQAERAAKEAKLAGRIAEANAALDAPAKRYGVILADPEWKFETWGEGGKDRAPENHYPTTRTDEIAARPVANLAAEDCVLFLWATPPMLEDALRVLKAWGFRYVTHCIWDKGQIGLGYWFRFRHELLLVGVRGNVPAPAMGTQAESFIEEPLAELEQIETDWTGVVAVWPGEHSAKPERFHALIEEYFPTLPKIELNARRARDGWDVWGAEAPEVA